MRKILTLAFCLTLLVPAAVAAADAGAPEPVRFPAVGAADTVRTNLWLVQALMGEIAREAAAALPPAPGRVALRPAAEEGAGIFQAAAHAELAGMGYSVFLDESRVIDPSLRESYSPPLSDYTLRFDVETLDLSYPRVGRNFGLWRQWVDRELEVAVVVTLVDDTTGRLLLDRRIVRGFGDRVASRHLEAVESRSYPFTAASVSESGWRSVLEELLVVGALSGMVAIYFANSGS